MKEHTSDSFFSSSMFFFSIPNLAYELTPRVSSYQVLFILNFDHNFLSLLIFRSFPPLTWYTYLPYLFFASMFLYHVVLTSISSDSGHVRQNQCGKHKFTTGYPSFVFYYNVNLFME